MINVFLDELLEFNDKVVRILANVDSMEILAFHFYDYKTFLDPRINSQEIEALKVKFSHFQKEIEKDFNHRLLHSLERMNLSLDEAILIDSKFLNDYFKRKDPNDLIITALCLETLWYHKYKSKWFETAYPSLAESVSSYDDCFNFMREFCPEVVSFYVKAMKKANL